MSDLKEFLKQEGMSQLFQHSTIGIEKEGHRVTPAGKLAATPHPQKVDGSQTSFYIQRDFAESQLELVTPPIKNNEKEVMQWLQAIHEVALRSLDEDERIWPSSMPPVLPADDQIQVAALELASDVAYREYLVEAYGKKVQMISGIHYNFQLNPQFIKAYYQASGCVHEMSLITFQSNLYLRLARNFLRYQWILVYLFGAAPLADDSFYNQPADKFSQPIRSIRNSRLGYINKDDVTFNFDTLVSYVDELEQNVRDGRLIAEKEFYSNVRLRGAKQARDLLTSGISYLEFRIFDIQPFEEFGISVDDILFVEYFILYLIWLEEDHDMSDVVEGIQRKQATAEEGVASRSQYYQEGMAMLAGMRSMLTAIEAPGHIQTIVERMVERFEDPHLTPAARIMAQVETPAAWLDWVNDLADLYARNAKATPYALGGFTDMELSTQILMFDAIQQGYQIDILDRTDQLLRLRYRDHHEYIKNGNITSKDPYIGYYLMENKVVTKQILAEGGYAVPQSDTYASLEQVNKVVDLYAHKPIVVKPKSTNMGLGISIFKNGAPAEQLLKAFRLAFAEDDDILVEEFVAGTEYRFFVLNGKVLAVLLRVPANIKGDGEHTIRELVLAKNDNPLRGYNHRSPLEKIALGELEEISLNEQGFNFDSIPTAGEVVYLRENSNISTGGDSVDVTDQVHQSYKNIAAAMAETLGVKITGLDIMIDDISQPASDGEEPTNYGIIEANFNPMMMMHIYPSEGKGIRITRHLLDFLFPEKATSTNKLYNLAK